MNYLSSIFESFLGEPRKHNEETGQIAFDCPACSADKGLYEGDGKGNLEINYNKGVYKCWVCHDTNRMHGQLENLVRKYGTRTHLKEYNLFKPEYNYNGNKDNEKIIVRLPDGYKKLSDCTDKDYKSDLAKKYLKDRGITDEIIKEFNIGYTITGDFKDRIIIPSYDADGNINYFIARWFLKKKTKVKYLNPNAEKYEIIFNENKVNWDATIYLVEGATDHIVVPNSIPLLGKFIADKLKELLHTKAKSFIVILLDSDAYEDAEKLYWTLNTADLKGRIKICTPPEGHDPSSIFQYLGSKGIVKLLRNSRQLKQ
jgi:DNA primase